MDPAHQPPPTLRQIGAAAGVSASTVSLALRDHPSISQSTRERIRELAQKMGYRSDAVLAKAMAHLQRSREKKGVVVLGIVNGFPWRLPHKTIPQFGDFWQPAFAHADAHGYKLEEFWVHEPGMTLQRLREILKARGIEGLLVTTATGGAGYLDFDLTGFSAVCVGPCLWSPAIHSVATDHSQAMRLALDEVLSLGYQRIGLALPGGMSRMTGGDSVAVYHDYVVRGRIVSPVRVYDAEHHDLKPFVKWYEREKPEVIIGHPITLGWLKEAGVKVPDACGFAGIGIISAHDRCSGVDRRLGAQAVACVDLLISLLHNNARGAPTVPMRLLVGGMWCPGNTLRRL